MENFYFEIIYITDICYSLAACIASRTKLEVERKI